MPSIDTNLTVRDGTITLSLELRLWKDEDGRGIIALDPADGSSRAFMVNHRSGIRAAACEKYGLNDLAVYEGQGNGQYTPQDPKGGLMHGATLTIEKLTELGEFVSSQAWKHGKDLNDKRLPPPTPHTLWPR